MKATLEGRPALLALVARVAERLAIPFTVGGGVRSVADGASLLRAGADKVSVNTAALARRSHAGSEPTGRSAVDWAVEAEERGAGEILLTSMATDGTRAGYDLDLTAAVAAAVSVPVIASGGAGGARHVAAALEVAQAALLASILHERPDRLTSLRHELHGLGVPLRDAA